MDAFDFILKRLDTIEYVSLASDAGKPIYSIDELRILIKHLKDEWRTMKHD